MGDLLDFIWTLFELLGSWRFFLPFVGSLLFALWLAGHIPNQTAGVATGIAITIAGCYAGNR